MTFMWGRFLTSTAIIMGVGYGLLATTTPTEEEFYNRLSPELKRKVDEIRAAREGQSPVVKDALSAAGDEGRIVWGDDLKKLSDQAKK